MAAAPRLQITGDEGEERARGHGRPNGKRQHDHGRTIVERKADERRADTGERRLTLDPDIE